MNNKMHFEQTDKLISIRESIMLWLNREGRKYTTQEFIDLGETEQDKKHIADALQIFHSSGMLKIDENKKIRLQGTLRL